MRKKLNVLHLASFNGNIGDNANHNGARRLLKENLDFDLDFTNLEIREFHWGWRKFDNEFIKLANQHDLVIIGGGNYFELWVEKSRTGTTIDLPYELLKEINSPILFHALGCDPAKGVPKQNIEKFKAFLEVVLSSDQFLVSVRNDGSIDTISNIIGQDFADKICKIPDGGFFVKPKDYSPKDLGILGKFFAVNIAGDMLETRFSNSGDNNISYDVFIEKFSDTLQLFLDEHEDYTMVLIPHIFRDLQSIYDILEKVEDYYRRKRIIVAPYLQGEGSEKYIFSLYKHAEFAMGMRFHTNVCSIGLNTPTIGLVNYPLLSHMYNDIGLSDRIVKVNRNNFDVLLHSKMNDTLKNTISIKNEYSELVDELRKELNNFHEQINNWLKTFY